MILCDSLFWNVRMIFPVPRLGTVSGWVLGFNRICPAHQGVMHRRKLRFTHVKISISPSSPNGPHHALNHHFQNQRAILKESAKERYITESLIKFTCSPSSIPLLASSSPPPHSLPRQSTPLNYQAFKKERGKNSINARLKIPAKEETKPAINQTKPNKATYSKVSTGEKKTLTFTKIINNTRTDFVMYVGL